MSYRELLIGCGASRDKRVQAPDTPPTWSQLLTLDLLPRAAPDVVCDLDRRPWGANCGVSPAPAVLALPIWRPKIPGAIFADDVFSEVHAYEVLEHLGQQGNWREFLSCFEEIWHILAPGGYLCATTPALRSRWLLGDPGHTRVVLPESLAFVNQPNYAQVGLTPMSDYRDHYHGDFDIVHSREYGDTHRFILRAVKPARI